MVLVVGVGQGGAVEQGLVEVFGGGFVLSAPECAELAGGEEGAGGEAGGGVGEVLVQ